MSISFASAGLARPPLSRNTAPTKNPLSLSFPARNCASWSGFAASVLSTMAAMASGSLIWVRPRSSTSASTEDTEESTETAPASRSGRMSFPALPLITPVSMSVTNSASVSGRSGIEPTARFASLFSHAVTSPVSQLASRLAGAPPCSRHASKYLTISVSSTSTCTSAAGSPSALYRARTCAGSSGMPSRHASTKASENSSGGKSGSGKYR